MALSTPQAESEYQVQSLSSTVIGLNIALPVVATIAVVLRLVAQRSRGARWKADGFVLIAALVGFFGCCLVESVLRKFLVRDIHFMR